jgi:hypothetical protein
MKGVYKLGGRFLHSKTVRVVHVGIGPRKLPFTVTAL